MKTVHIVVGVAAIAGLAWYLRNKRMAAGQTMATTETVTHIVTTAPIPMPQSEVQATNIVKLPSTLLPFTSGNTGIVPPVLKTGSTPINTITPVKTPIYNQKNLQGFALN